MPNPFPDIERLWTETATRFGAVTERQNIAEDLDNHAETCAKEVDALLPGWIALLDESLQCLLALDALIWHVHSEEKSLGLGGCLSSLARAAACLAGVRRLALAGLEDAARPVARSLVETLDIAIMCLIDLQFADAYIEAEDENVFWRQNIARGRLVTRLRTQLLAIGVAEDQVSSYLDERTDLIQEFSPSTHGSIKAALRARFVPSLRHAGRFSPDFLGHVSELTPFLIGWCAGRVHSVAQMIVSLVLTNSPVAALRQIDPKGPATMTFFSSFFVLQDLVVLSETDLQERLEVMKARVEESDE